ncbi:AzlD domain-containing protein [Mesobacterium pallidum]|uniref:AzlD domain-containing protein n=1 Tax=Mesobacterium pallidum TaxID=2872037 RepID=UPI001EE1A102|nr:AzlD domain-containing protein [Mesobacterium pallidum]
MTGDAQIWTVIVGLATASFLLRFIFLGMVGSRALPRWLMRHLRYTGVSIIPALVAPAVLWPAATEGQTDPLRLAAAFATVAAGFVFKQFFAAIAVGAAVMALGLTLGP